MIEIETIRRYCKDDRLITSRHVSFRMRERAISFAEIRTCILEGEIIEQYPADTPYPSCLICGTTGDNRTIHVVIGDEGTYGTIITAYIPNVIIFEDDLKTRRRKT